MVRESKLKFHSCSTARTASCDRASADRFMQYLDPAGAFTNIIGMIAEFRWLPRYSWEIPQQSGLSCSCELVTITLEKLPLRQCDFGKKSSRARHFLMCHESRDRFLIFIFFFRVSSDTSILLGKGNSTVSRMQAGGKRYGEYVALVIQFLGAGVSSGPTNF